MQYETPTSLKRFGEKLRKLRLEKGLSLNLFAFENDLSKASVSKIERGIIDFRFSTLIQIANALEMNLSDLLELEENKD